MRINVPNMNFGYILVLAWIGLLFVKPVSEMIDDATTDQPWFDMQIEIGDGTVDYSRTINRWMRGIWVASVMVPSGDSWRGVCAGDGRYTYRPETSGSVNMAFEYFTGGCAQPSGPHRVCVDYVMTDRRGVVRDFGPYCDESLGAGT